MDYFKILNLSREPFSNSPDPDQFFFKSRQHVDCLQKVELAVRLCRGLNVVIGDVGTGKTTLCRRLIRHFANDAAVETHLILDPYFCSPLEFLSAVSAMFGLTDKGSEMSDWEFKEEIKKYLFNRAVGEEKIIVLIIDEGQKLSESCLEILREFLNYETNEKKLLQIVIFAQDEFRNFLRKHENFADRINLYHMLGPMNFRDTREMIRYRLDLASTGEKSAASFSLPALWAIYRASRGYPRKIINICHRAILTIIIQNRTKVNLRVARFCIRKSVPGESKVRPWVKIAVSGAAVILILGVVVAKGYAPFPWSTKALNFFDDEKLNVEPVKPGAVEQGVHFKSADVKELHPGQAVLTAQEGESKKAASGPGASLPDVREEERIPDVLGRIVVSEKDTLGSMILDVYGIFNEKYLKMVADFNSDIKNPDLIESGQAIEFPAVMAEVPRASLRSWWVLLDDKSTLEEAYGFIKTHTGRGIHMAIVPNWNGRDGLRFSVLQRKIFKDEESARRMLVSLSGALFPDATLKGGWASDTIFFASPVF